MRHLQRHIVAGALALAWTIPAAPALSHPMGNVSINHYAAIEVSPDSVLIKYLLDFAEIPSVRELERVDPDGDDRVTPEERDTYLAERTSEVLEKLALDVNGQEVPLRAAWSRVVFPPGEGGLSTVRIAWELRGAWEQPLLDSNFLKWSDRNHESASGWKEIRFSADGGLAVGSTSLRENPSSDGLTEYPKEYLYNPPTDTKAWCHFGRGVSAASDAGFQPPGGFAARRESRFVQLVSSTAGGPGPLVAALFLAMVLGAAHALEPGHGKTVVAAYLVGTRGTVGQAVLLGLVVTFTHTFSVFLLGGGVLLLSRFVLPERIMPWLELLSGMLIVAVGAYLLRSRWRAGRHRDPDHVHGHDHPDDHGHAPHDHAQGVEAAHTHTHAHGPGARPHRHVPERATLGSILALGISGGLVPCPAGIVVLLSAVALGRIAFGLLLIIAFGVGLAVVLMAVATLFVTARRLFDRLPIDDRHTHALGLASAAIVTVFGLVLVIRSLLGGHLPGF